MDLCSSSPLHPLVVCHRLGSSLCLPRPPLIPAYLSQRVDPTLFLLLLQLTAQLALGGARARCLCSSLYINQTKPFISSTCHSQGAISHAPLPHLQPSFWRLPGSGKRPPSRIQGFAGARRLCAARRRTGLCAELYLGVRGAHSRRGGQAWILCCRCCPWLLRAGGREGGERAEGRDWKVRGRPGGD
jgi:hypothetical protein